MTKYNQTFKQRVVNFYFEYHENLSLTLCYFNLSDKTVIPAYDRFFKDTFSEIAGEKCGFSTPNETSLNIIAQFYQENKEEIDALSKNHSILDFERKPTNYRYSKAKIIDMYGFQVGRDKVSENP